MRWMSRKGRLVSLTFCLSLVLAVGHELVVGADREDVDQHLSHCKVEAGVNMRVSSLSNHPYTNQQISTVVKNLPFSPTKGRLHVKTSMKLGSQ